MHWVITAYGLLDRPRFREILHACFGLLEDLMLDRMYFAFDKNNDGQINATEWVEGCSIIIRGTPAEIIDFSYFLSTTSTGTAASTGEEVFQYLRKTLFLVPGVLPQDDYEDGIKDLVELAMKKLDRDRDGQITYKDYEKSCHTDPLLVQALGPFIPSTQSLAAFLACFSERVRHYSPEWGDVWLKAGKKYHHSSAANSTGGRGSVYNVPGSDDTSGSTDSE